MLIISNLFATSFPFAPMASTRGVIESVNSCFDICRTSIERHCMDFFSNFRTRIHNSMTKIIRIEATARHCCQISPFPIKAMNGQRHTLPCHCEPYQLNSLVLPVCHHPSPAPISILLKATTTIGDAKIQPDATLSNRSTTRPTSSMRLTECFVL